MSPAKIALLALGAASIVAAAASSSDEPDSGGGGVSGWTRKQIIWGMLQSIPELQPVHRYALMLIAKREGNYNPAAHNGSVSERAASAKAADKSPSIVQRASNCGVPLSSLQSGSWTTFQLLAPYASGTAFEVFGNAFCPFADPTKLTGNLAVQIALAIEHARDLQVNYPGFAAWPTVGALYLGWGQPSRMGADAPDKWRDRLDIYRAVAKGEKFPAGIVDAHLPTFPGNPAQIYASLRGIA